MRPDIAVVIVTYNSASVAPALLDSLPAALGDLKADVVVVDNGSTDDTVAVLSARGDCRVIPAANTGYAGGVNRGIAEAAEVEPILVLNPDVRLHPGAVPPMLAALAQPKTAAVAPKVLNPDGTLHSSLRREPTLLRAAGLNRTGIPALAEWVIGEEHYREPHVVDWALGAVLLLSRSCYLRLGGWDDSFFLYSEETDYLLRARDAGWVTRYEPAASAMHIGGGSGRNDLTHVMLIINRVRLYRRRHGRIASWAYYGLTVLSELSWLARRQRESRASVAALLSPRRRPAQLRCSSSLMPS